MRWFKVVIGADFWQMAGDEETMGCFGVKERNLDRQVAVDSARRMKTAVVNIYFQRREKQNMINESVGRLTEVDLILCRPSKQNFIEQEDT